MRVFALVALAAYPLGIGFGCPEPAARAAGAAPQPADKAVPKEAAKPTPAAELTRTKSLQAKMSVAFTDARLGDVLKEFAAQVDMKAETQLLWAYGPGFPFAQKVTYTCKDQPLEEALDELFKKVGGLGYVVVSKDGDRRDGWVRLTTTGERGYEKGAEPAAKATEAEEAEAAEKLTRAKKLIESGKDELARTELRYVLKRYPGTRAAAEAKKLLAKLDK
jgi:hypothetical protein